MSMSSLYLNSRLAHCSDVSSCGCVFHVVGSGAGAGACGGGSITGSIEATGSTKIASSSGSKYFHR